MPLSRLLAHHLLPPLLQLPSAAHHSLRARPWPPPPPPLPRLTSSSALLLRSSRLASSAPLEARRGGRAVAMANVTRANFWEAGERLQTHLRDADFVALDFEMTGVEAAPWRRRHCEMDTCETRYLHLKHSAQSFAVWQCGVCSFKWDDLAQKFLAHPYNFFIFPRDELPVEMPTPNFSCQTSSLEFLAKHRFDFNATIYTGISYLSLEQEEIARVKLGLADGARKAKHSDNEREIRLNKTADVVFTERVRVQVGQWRDGVIRHRMQRQAAGKEGRGAEGSAPRSLMPPSEGSPGREAADGASEPEAEAGSRNDGTGAVSGEKPAGLRPCYYVDTLGNYQARLVKQVIRKHYQDLVAIMPSKPINDERRQVRIIFTSSNEDKEKLEEELEAKDRRDLELVLSNAVGFRKIIDAIRSSGKPLIGHNCFLDLAHLHDKFIGPLPSTVKGFAASLRRHFTCILDTKYLLKAEPTLRNMSTPRSTSLAKAYQELCQGFSEKGDIPGLFYDGKQRIPNRPMSRVKLEIASDLQRYSTGTDTGLKHEAGFDAYMTGAVFAQICHILRVDVATLRSLARPPAGESRGFASFANLLMLQTFRGTAALDLRTGSEAVGISAPRGPSIPPFRSPRRENVAIVWGAIPADDPEVFLRGFVQKVRNKDNRSLNVDIYPLDETAAFVEFRSREVLEFFMKAFQDSVTEAGLRTGGPEGLPIKVATFDAYERICRSPLDTPFLGAAADLMGLNQIVQPNPAQADDRGSNVEADAGGFLESGLDVSNEGTPQSPGLGFPSPAGAGQHGRGSLPSAARQTNWTKRESESSSLGFAADAGPSKRPREATATEDSGKL